MVSAGPLLPGGEERRAELREPVWWAFPGAAGGAGAGTWAPAAACADFRLHRPPPSQRRAGGPGGGGSQCASDVTARCWRCAGGSLLD